MLQDVKGEKVAKVSITSPLAMLTQVLEGNTSSMTGSYDIMKADDSASIAKISRQLPQRTSVFMQMANFVLSITVAGAVPTLTLVEFTIAVDHLYSSSSTVRRSGFGVGPGNIGPGGFGGGGMNIRF